MLKTLLISVVAFVLFATPARADWCQNASGPGYRECAPEEHGGETCGTATSGQPIYCAAPRSGSGKTSAKMSTTEVVILTVGVGLVVAGLAYYFFHKKPSENNPGQISLMSF